MTAVRHDKFRKHGEPGAAEAAALPFRTAPHNLEAEQALLGAILVNNEAHDRVSGFLEPRHFYDPLHQQIYDTAAKLISSGKQATPITLRTFFEKSEPIDAGLSVPQYLGRLAANAATIINARDYGRTIHDLATRRQLILIGEDMVNVAFDSPVDFPPKEQIEEAETRLFSIAEYGENERAAATFNEAMGDAIAAIDEAFRRGDGFAGLSSGIAALDVVLGGLTPGGLFVLAGRPGMGKTALALNIAFAIASTGVPVGFVSLEMSSGELAMRQLSAETGVSTNDLRRGQIEPDTMRRLLATRARHASLPLYIDASGGLTLPQLARNLRRMRRRQKIGFGVVDYLQLLGGAAYRGQNRTQEITEITTGLKSLAKELGIPILALSQLSREVEKREGNRPLLSDLRDSGSIEQDADVVAFVFREECYLQRQPPDATSDNEYQRWQDRLAASLGKAEVIVAKLRNGPTGTAHLTFDQGTMTFGSSPDGGGA